MSDSIEPNGAGPSAEGSGSGDGGVQTPEGFVPKADFDKVETQRREFQASLDKRTQELEALRRSSEQAPVSPATGDAGATPSFDPDAFRRSLMSDVLKAQDLRAAAEAARAEFPHADPAIFGERLGDFASPAAIRLAAEVSHTRVQAVIDAQFAEREKAIREEMDKRYGGSNSTPAGPQGLPGDPTVTQLAQMSQAELDAIEARLPGVIQRVLHSTPQ